jgi:hypothetical protein
VNNESNTRYNQVRQKSSHNSYERTEGLYDQAISWRIRALELDLHNGKSCSGRPNLVGNWYIYHFCGPGGTSTSVDKMTNALDVLVGFRTAVPDHEAMLVFLDMKDDWNADHSPEQLDQLIESKLGRPSLWTPRDLGGGTNDLQGAIRQQGWPVLGSLRGKFVFALTGGDVKSAGTVLNRYVDDGRKAGERVAFVAPSIGSIADIEQKNYVVFFNLSDGKGTLARDVFRLGFMSRMYDVNSQGSWNAAVSAGVHVIATNKVNQKVDTWARTDNTKGWPFQGIEVTMDPNLTEPGALYGIEVSSGDIWGKNDSFYFAYNDKGGAPDATFASFVSSPASHVQDWAKGGILARASLDADAAYFGVFRTGTKDLRVQYRKKKGDSTDAKEVDIVPTDTVDENTLIYIRLDVSNGGKHAEGWGSLDARTWTKIAELDFGEPLRFQGWGASSHGDDAVKFLFGVPGAGPVSFASQRAIGKDVRLGRFFAGVYP